MNPEYPPPLKLDPTGSVPEPFSVTVPETTVNPQLFTPAGMEPLAVTRFGFDVYVPVGALPPPDVAVVFVDCAIAARSM